MSQLVSYAERELDRIGMGDPDADYNGALKPAIMSMVKLFADQDHSGASAPMAIAMLERLLRFEPLSPLTGEDDEWMEVANPRKPTDTTHQNVRCPHVFKRADGSAFDLDHKDGFRADITFPYTPGDS